MGFKDAMKTNAESLARKSMEAGAKGQAKMESMQAKRRGHASCTTSGRPCTPNSVWVATRRRPGS